MILSTIAILDPGYGRLSGWLWSEPQVDADVVLLQLLGRHTSPHGDGCLGRKARPADEAIRGWRNGPRRPPVFARLPLPLGSVEVSHHGTDRGLGEALPISQVIPSAMALTEDAPVELWRLV